MDASPYRPLREAARIAVIYALVAALWILLSDQVLSLLVSSPRLSVAIGMLKGLGFVATTACILFFVLRAEFAARERVAQRLQHYQALAENSQDIMLFIEEPGGRILEANRAAVQSYGLSRAELLQKTIANLRHPSTLGDMAGQLQRANTEGVRFETVHRRRDGSPFPVEVSSQGLTLGRNRILLSVIRDITERKQMEQELAWLASFPQLNPNPIIEVDLAGSVEFLNRAAESALPNLKQRGLEHPWLAEWEPVESGFRDRQRGVSQREVQVGDCWYLQTMHYVTETHRVRIYGVEITERKQAEAEQQRLALERDRLLDRLQELNLGLEQRVQERTSELSQREAALSKTQAQLLQSDASLRDALQSLRALVQRRAEAQESERAYVADQLYNEAAQVLAVVQMQQSRLERELARGQAAPELWVDLKSLVDRVLSELHHLAVHLRPATLDRLGLVPALDQYLAEFGRTHQLNVRLATLSMNGTRVPPEVATVLYRIVQEALTNVARHAHATNVGVLIRGSASRLSVVVEDDGIGFDVDEALRQGALGLLGMRERAEALSGCLEVESRREGAGTTIVVDVPLEEVS